MRGKELSVCLPGCESFRTRLSASEAGRNRFRPIAGLLLRFGLLAALLWGQTSPAAVTWADDFSSDPAGRGWTVWGDASFYQWNAATGNLAVTWDSRQTNTYWVHPLGTVLTTNDDFTLGFDLWLSDITVGISTNHSTFEIALGLINRRDAFQSNFFRGAGQVANGPRNLVEFDYFPAAAAITATFSPTAVSTNNRIQFSDNHPLAFPLNLWLRFVLAYTASNQTLHTTITTNGVAFGKSPGNAIADLVLANDFRVDAFAVCSYSEAGQPRGFGGSVLAHGALDNLYVTMPDPPVGRVAEQFANGHWQAQVVSQNHWLYTLERSPNLLNWSDASAPIVGSGSLLALPDTNVVTAGAFHRVRAVRE